MDDKGEKEIRRMSKKEFFSRLAVWFVLAVAVPFTYIAIEYGIFNSSDGKRLSGWGIVALVFVCAALMYIISQARKSLPYGSFVRQCIDGILGLIPLFGAIMLLEVIKDGIASFERFLIIVLASEALAIPVNPLPHWGLQNHLDLSQYSIFNAISRALDKKEK